jgi:hypothetical protein
MREMSRLAGFLTLDERQPAAWSSGCSIFAYPVPSKTDEHTKQEIMALYRELAKLVMERAAEGGTHHG